jgi:hypothetical protein
MELLTRINVFISVNCERSGNEESQINVYVCSDEDIAGEVKHFSRTSSYNFGYSAHEILFRINVLYV